MFTFGSVKKLFEKYTLFWMGMATLVAFPLVAFVLLVFLPASFHLSFIEMFELTWRDIKLIPIFLSAGISFGLFVIWLTELDYFEKSLAKYRNLLDNYKLTTFHVIFLSICAGLGEEVFFRGAMQPLINVFLNHWYAIAITAVFFVAIHGYFSFKNKRVNLFAVLLTLFIVLLGWSAHEYSLWLAIAGHFSYDLVLLFYYKEQK
jgi:membrane protease YdiL (CAAX protease family)